MKEDFFKNLFDFQKIDPKDIDLFNSILENHADNSDIESNDNIIEKIQDIISEFSFKDVLISSFALNSWLPNRSSLFKQYLINTAISTLPIMKYKLKYKIDTYQHFISFTKKLLKLFGNYIQLEDFIPELDNGELYYHYKNINYKVFYSGGYTCMYEYYSLFEIIYSFPPELQKQFNINFDKDFKTVLEYQEKIISITSKNNSFKEIENSGMFETPSVAYWKHIKVDFDKLIITSNNTFEKLNNDTIDKEDNFMNPPNKFMSGNPGPIIVKHGEELFPLFTRSYIMNVFNYYEKYHKVIPEYELFRNIKINISKYIYNRFPHNAMALLQIYDKVNEKISGEIIYDFGFLNNEILYLFFSSEEKNKEVLDKIIENEKDMLLTSNGCFIEHWNHNTMTTNVIKIAYKEVRICHMPINFNSMMSHYSYSNKYKNIPVKDILYIFDSLESIQEYEEYEIFEDKYAENTRMSFDRINLFAMFKSSLGEIVKGNEKYNMISIFPHSADEYRIEELKKHWSIGKYVPFGNPCEWNLESLGHNHFSMFHKASSLCNDIVIVGNSVIRIGFSMAYFSTHEEFEIANFLLQIISYNIIEFEKFLKKYSLFSKENEIIIKIIPTTILTKKEFEHLRHLDQGNMWNMDYKTKGFQYLIRLVFDMTKCSNFYNRNLSRKDERLIFEKILDILQLNNIIPITKKLQETAKNKSHFRINTFESAIERPDFHKEFKIEDKYFVTVRKEIALLISNQNIKEGKYLGKNVLPVLTSIRDVLLLNFKNFIKQYDISFIKYFLCELDKTFLHSRIDAEKFNQNNFDSIDDKNIHTNEKTTEQHRVFTFIIENMLFFNEFGNKTITNDDAKYIYAYAKWLVVDVYNSIEQVLYDIHNELELHIEKNMLFYLESPESYSNKLNLWKKYMTDSIYNGNDISTVLSKENFLSFIDDLNVVFDKNYQFKFEKMLYICDILYKFHETNDIVIKINKENLVNFLENVSISDNKKMNKSEIKNALTYLEMESTDLGKILKNGKWIEKTFIDYDEKLKRPYRLVIKPLIKIHDEYYIIRELCQKTRSTYMRHLQNGKLPYRNENNDIQEIVDTYSKLIQDKLVERAFEIVINSGYSESFIEKEREIYKLDAKGNHEKELGDYDLLIFDEQRNTIFNIECKYISQSFAAKDLKNDLESLYGIKKGFEKSYIGHFLKRQNYLKTNAEKICENIGYNFTKNINVIPIFLTYTSNFFLKNPLVESNIVYLTLNEFQNYLSNFKTKYSTSN